MIPILDYGMGNLRSVQKALTHLGFDAQITSSLGSASHAILPGVGAFGAAMAALNSSGLAEDLRSFVASGGKLLGICLGQQLLFEVSDEFGETAGLGLLSGRVRYLPAEGVKVPHVGWNGLSFPNSSPCLQGEVTPRHAEGVPVTSLGLSEATPQEQGHSGIDPEGVAPSSPSPREGEVREQSERGGGSWGESTSSPLLRKGPSPGSQEKETGGVGAFPSPLLAGIAPGDQVYFVHSLYCDCANPADAAAISHHGIPVAAAVQRGTVYGCQFHPEKSSAVGLRILQNFLES